MGAVLMSARRNRRAGIEDLWHFSTPRPMLDDDGNPAFGSDGEPITTDRTKLYGKGKRWRARYVDDNGEEHTQRFEKKPTRRTG